MQAIRRKDESQLGFLIRSAVTASFSGSIAEIATIPFDTVKVRLQMQNTTALKIPMIQTSAAEINQQKGQVFINPLQQGLSEPPKYRGLIGTTLTVVKEEGATALYKGLVAGVHRQLLFAGLRVGLYLPVRDAICGPLKEGQNPALYQKALAALTTGAIGITVANPTDVVKVRLQNQRKSDLMSGDKNSKQAIKYNGTLDCYRKTIQQEGIKGLWTSWSANIFRNSIINCVELVTYDQYKEILLKKGIMNDGMYCYLTCAFAAGINGVIFGSPLDCLTTRHMSSPGVYKNPLDCLLTIVRNEGFLALYKGFIPNVARLGGFNIVLWVTIENVKKFQA